jgi:hypothetical protein
MSIVDKPCKLNKQVLTPFDQSRFIIFLVAKNSNKRHATRNIVVNLRLKVTALTNNKNN